MTPFGGRRRVGVGANKHRLEFFDDGAHEDGDAGDGLFGAVFMNTQDGGSFSVTAELIGEYVQERRSRDHVKPRTTNRDLQLLKLMFNRVIDAKRWAKVLENPVCYVKLASETDQRVRYLDQEEIRSLIDACDEHIRPIVLTALRTGMRRGELFRLTWSDINFERGFILIRDPKSGRDQEIPLNAQARQVLDTHPKADSPYVFPGRNGRQRTDIRKQVNLIKERAGLPNNFRALHGLRHVFASTLASSGKVDMYTLQKLLTHKSPTMTQRYAHLRDEALRSASDLAGELLEHQMGNQENKSVSSGAEGLKNE